MDSQSVKKTTASFSRCCVIRARIMRIVWNEFRSWLFPSYHNF